MLGEPEAQLNHSPEWEFGVGGNKKTLAHSFVPYNYSLITDRESENQGERG